MGQNSAAEVCRLLVIGPASQVDLSVPTHVPLSDLMPALLRGLGPDLADRGLEHSGWVAQRPGEASLDEDLSVADHGLLDGDTLHVRPRSDQLPPLDFDDLIDGVASGMRARSGLWRPRTTRAASVLALVVWLVVALLVPLLDVRLAPAAGTGAARADAAASAGGGLSGRAVLVGVAALVLLAVTAVVGRLDRDRTVAALFGGGVVALAAEAAVLAVLDAGPAGRAAGRVPLLLVAGAGATLVAVLLALAVLSAREALYPAVLAVVAMVVAAILASLLSSIAGLDWTGVATVLVLLCVAARPGVPMAAFKLAGMALPPLPVEPGDLQDDIDPEPGGRVLARTARADRYMTALYAACGVVSIAGLVWLALSPGWMPVTVAGLVGLAQVLASRPITSIWHRLALCLPAFAGLVAYLLSRPAAGGGLAIAPMLLALLFAAVAAGSRTCSRAGA